MELWIFLGAVGAFLLFGDKLVGMVWPKAAVSTPVTPVVVGPTPTLPVVVKKEGSIGLVETKRSATEVQIELTGGWTTLRALFVEAKLDPKAVKLMDDIFPLLNVAASTESVTGVKEGVTRGL